MPTRKPKKPAPLLICDDTHGQHVWDREFNDGDTCACGRFYLDLHPVQGFRAELVECRKWPERAYGDLETEPEQERGPQ